MGIIFRILTLCILSVLVEDSNSSRVNDAQLSQDPNLHKEELNITVNNTTVSEYFSFSQPLIVFMFTKKSFAMNISVPCDTIGQNFSLTVSSASEDIFSVGAPDDHVLTCSSLVRDEDRPGYLTDTDPDAVINGTIELTLTGNLLGFSEIKIKLKAADVIPEVFPTPSPTTLRTITNGDTNNTIHEKAFKVTVLRNITAVEKIFMIFMTTFIILITLGFGCKLDLGIVKECLKKPIAPGIGFGCQYLVMPLLGFAIAKLLPLDADRSVALGIFVCGVCPGGGASNIYSYLLDGDVSLSITMTFLSTIASIGMMPLWIYTLGRLFLEDDYRITVPYINLLQVCALVTLPLLVGVFIKYKYFKAAVIVMKILKPVTIIGIIVFTTLGIYTNLFIFKLFRPLHIIAGCLLPYLGYLMGGAIAAILRQPFYRVKTIALETGMQNVGVAYILMISSFPPPYGDLASVAPMASGLATPLPPFVITIAYLLYKKCCKKYEPVNVDEQEVDVNGVKQKVKVNGTAEDENNVLTEKLSTV